MKKIFITPLFACLYLFNTAQVSPSVKLIVDNGKYGESEWTRQLALTADDKILIANDFENGLRLFDVETGSLLNSFEGHSLEGDSYFDPATNILITTGDRKIKVWDISKQQLIKEIRQAFHSQFMNDVYIDSRKKYIIAQKVKYDFATSKAIKTYSYEKMYFFKDRYYTFNKENGKVSQYDVFTDQLLKTYILERYTKGVSFFFNEHTGKLFIGYVDGVRISDITTGNSAGIGFDRRHTFDNLGITSNFDYSYDDLFFIATSNQGKDNRIGGDGHFVVIKNDPATNTYAELYRDDKVSNEIIPLNKSNRVIISRGSSLELVDLEKLPGEQAFTWKTYPALKSITQMLVSKNNRLLLKFGGKRIHVLDVKRALGDQYDENTALHYFNPIGNASFENEYGFCEFKPALNNNDIPNELSLLWRERPVHGIYNLASGDFREINNLPEPEEEFISYGTLNSPQDPVKDENYSPSQNYYAIENSFSDVSFYSNGKKIVSAPTTGVIYHIEYSKDEKYAAFGGSDRTITIVDLKNKRKLHALNGNSYITSISFSNDNKYVFSGSLKNEVLMFDMITGRLMKKFTGANGSIRDIEVNKDGTILAGTADDNALRFWDIKTGKLLITSYFDYNLNHLSFTAEGFFNKSENFYGSIAYRVGESTVSFDQLYDQYYRPDIIKATLNGISAGNTSLLSISKGVKKPPLVRIDTKDITRGTITLNTSSTQSDNQKIIVTVIDDGGGIKGVRVFNNKKLVEEKLLENILFNDSLKIETDIALTGGSNVIEAIGMSSDQTESKPVQLRIQKSSTGTQGKKSNLYIIAVGINEYKNPKYNLNYCLSDMNSFSDSLKSISAGLFNSIQLKKIQNNEATKERIQEHLNQLKELVTVNDVLVFFYAGHGIAFENGPMAAGNSVDFYYVLHNVIQMTDKNSCVKNGLSGTELKSMLKNIKANKQLLFIDACNSGAMAEQFAVRGAAEENALARLSRSSGSAIFASTTKDQYASEFGELKHGVFTYVLLQGFAGGAAISNCQVTAASLKSFIDDQTPLYTEKYKGQAQYPTTFLFGQDFPLGIRCKPSQDK